MARQVWRVSTRGEFEQLRRSGRTVRRGPLAIRSSPSSGGPAHAAPRVAYAIGRPVGNAVVRNRLRRRLRHIVADLAATNRIPQGISLILVQSEAADLSFAELGRRVDSLFAELRESGDQRPR